MEDERIKLEVQKLKFDSEAKMREAQAERNSAVLVAVFKLLEKGNKQNKQIRRSRHVSERIWNLLHRQVFF